MALPRIFVCAFLTLCLASASAATPARNVSFLNVGTEAGLSHSGITAITQDNEGYIWIGTQEGLNRYNGYDAEIFEHDYSDPTSIGDDWVWSLLVDSQGNLWVGTNNGGLSLYDATTQSFVNFQHHPEQQDSLTTNQVRTVFEDSRGRLWVGTRGGGLNLFEPATRTFISFQAKAPSAGKNEVSPTGSSTIGLPGNTINVVYEWNETLLVGTDAGMALMDMNDGEFRRHESTSGMNVRTLLEHNGVLWIGTHENGLIEYNPLTGEQIAHMNREGDPGSLPGNLVRDLLIDHQGTLWIATDSGLAEWNPRERNFRSYLPDASDPYSIVDIRIDSLFEDRGQVLWIGTYNGLSRWNYASDVFMTYSTITGHLDNDVVTALSEDAAGSIWVGSYGGGVAKLDLMPGNSYEAGESLSFELEDQRVMALTTTGESDVWIGTRTAGLYCYDSASGEVTRYNAENSALSSNGITSLISSNGVVWIGTYGGGLNRYDLAEGSMTTYRHDPEDSNSLGSDRVLTISRDNSGQYWIGTEDGGLNRFNPLTGSFTRFVHDPTDRESLSNNTAWEILESSNGDLWIGTLSAGLNRWAAENRQQGNALFQRITKKQGLPGDTIYGVLEDDNGYLWLSSNRGLAKYNTDIKLFRLYDKSNGLRGDEFNFGPRLRTSTGMMMFGGYMGIVVFDPASVRPNPHVPTVVISASSNELEGIHSSSNHPFTDSLRLNYTDRFVDFRFAALDYSSPDKNQYQYRLEGFEDSWIDAESFRRATYTNLPAGDYVFRVRASNNDGLWNETGAAVSLRVIPPPWRTTWAYTLYALIVIGIVVAYLAMQRRKLVLAAEMQHQLHEQVRERTRELDERNRELEEANESLTRASMSDALTGLNNRRFLYEYLESQIATLSRLYTKVQHQADATKVVLKEGSLFFMMIDLDGFKKINDTYGHAAGDAALIQVKEVLKSCTRDSDTIIRWGGDEFLIVGHSEGLEGVQLLAERIRNGISSHNYVVGEGQIGYLGGSIGVAQYPFNASEPRRFTWEQVVALADQAAYISKANGGDSWVTLTGSLDVDQADVIMMRDNATKAVASGKVVVGTSVAGNLDLESRYSGSDAANRIAAK